VPPGGNNAYVSDVTEGWPSPNATQSWTTALESLVGGKEITTCWGVHLQGPAAELEDCVVMVGTSFEGQKDLSCHQM